MNFIYHHSLAISVLIYFVATGISEFLLDLKYPPMKRFMGGYPVAFLFFVNMMTAWFVLPMSLIVQAWTGWGGGEVERKRKAELKWTQTRDYDMHLNPPLSREMQDQLDELK